LNQIYIIISKIHATFEKKATEIDNSKQTQLKPNQFEIANHAISRFTTFSTEENKLKLKQTDSKSQATPFHASQIRMHNS